MADSDDYWGARVPVRPFGPVDWHTEHYYLPKNRNEYDTTQKSPGGWDIEHIYLQIMSQHPEVIATLAALWKSANDFLDSVKQQILKQSKALADEAWKSPKAKDAFMQRGPGLLLAYIDVWMDGAMRNHDGLHALVGIARDSRHKMTALWNEYKQELQKNKAPDTGFMLLHAFFFWETVPNSAADFWELVTKGEWKYDDPVMEAEALRKIQEVRDTYNQRAQNLAYTVASQYLQAFDLIKNGNGPPYKPPDARLTQPGHVYIPPLTLPGGPPSLPAVPLNSINPPQMQPPILTPPGVRVPALPELPGATPSLPEVPALPGALAALPTVPGTVPGALPTVPAMQALSVVPAAPILPMIPGLNTLLATVPGSATALPTVPGSGLFRNGLSTTPAGLPLLPGSRGNVRQLGGTLRGPDGLAQNLPPIPPGGGRQGRLGPPTGTRDGRTQLRGLGSAMGAGLGAAGLPPPLSRSGNASGRKLPPTSGRGGGLAERVGLDQPFAATSAGSVPPILGSPPQRRSTTDPAPNNRHSLGPASLGGPAALGLDHSPSVLTGPIRVLGEDAVGRPLSGMPPPPGSPTMGSPGRRRRRSERAGRPELGPVDPEWLGIEEAKAGAALPIVDSPAVPFVGRVVSGLEEVPAALRGRAPSGLAAPPTGRRKTRVVFPAAAGRRRKDETQTEEWPAMQPVTDQDAWTIRTPGDGVLSGRAEETPGEAPRPTLGGG